MVSNRFVGRVAIVTGAGQGMGFAIAERLAREGASVMLNDIGSAAVESAVTRIRADGGRVVSCVADVTRPDQVRALVERTLEQFGTVDILVNNAGVLRSSRVEEISEAEWDLVVGVNLKAAFLCAQAVFPIMKARRYGKIVNLASMAGRATSTLGGAHYTAAKAGLLGLSRHLGREAAPFGINVNAVCPGIVDTPMVQTSLAPAETERIAASIPFQRLAAPDEVAALIVFLASDEAAYITGASVDIHGGEMFIQ